VTTPLIFLGYLPKQLVARPEWLACPSVEFIASASECISSAPPGRIDLWKHNQLGLYDSEALARAMVPEDKSPEYTVFAYRALPVAFHDGKAMDWNPWAKEATAPPMLDERFDEHLGFDIVGFCSNGFFECSPLSCNGAAKDISVNSYCLVSDLQQAMAIAKKFSMPDSRVEPAWAYLVVDVIRQK